MQYATAAAKSAQTTADPETRTAYEEIAVGLGALAAAGTGDLTPLSDEAVQALAERMVGHTIRKL